MFYIFFVCVIVLKINERRQPYFAEMHLLDSEENHAHWWFHHLAFIHITYFKYRTKEKVLDFRLVISVIHAWAAAALRVWTGTEWMVRELKAVRWRHLLGFCLRTAIIVRASRQRRHLIKFLLPLRSQLLPVVIQAW